MKRHRARRYPLLATITFLLAVSAAGAAATDEYPGPYGEGTHHLGAATWDLTRSELTISYTLDLSAHSGEAVAAVGVDYGAVGYMESASPGASETDDSAFDVDDRHWLNAQEYGGGAVVVRHGPETYDVRGDGTVAASPFGAEDGLGFRFDRDGVAPDEEDDYEAGVHYDTGGVYEIVIRYRFSHIDADGTMVGTMTATINGASQNFPDLGIFDAGKTIRGDLTRLRVFATIESGDIELRDLVVQGTRHLDVDIDVLPDDALNRLGPWEKTVEVAIFGGPRLDVRDIDIDSLDLGGLAVATKGNGSYRARYEDSNGDGRTDLAVRFDRTSSDPIIVNGTVVLAGELLDGTPIRGQDALTLATGKGGGRKGKGRH
jgi:hypothetical protein